MRKIIPIIFFFISIGAHSESYSATLQPGHLIISEVMANPAQSSDTAGEWFEIFNTTMQPIDMNGLIISDDGSNLHQISSNESLTINAGSYFVMARNGDSTLNGGLTADYIYSNFTLNNAGDQIIISDDSQVLTRLDYAGDPFGISGVSAELIRQTTIPTPADYQLTQDRVYGLGDIGTPGEAGSVTLTASPVPLPGAVWLFASALLLLATKGRIRNFHSQQC